MVLSRLRAAREYIHRMSSWVVFVSALVVLVSIRLVLHQAVVEAWTRGHLAGRRAGVVVAVIIGMVPLALGLWLFLFSGDRLPGALLLAAWMLGYLPVALVMTDDPERYGAREEMGPQHS